MNAQKTIFSLAMGLFLSGLATAVAQEQTETKTATPDSAPKPSSSSTNVFTGTVVDAEGKAIVGATVAIADVETGHISWADTVYAYAPEERMFLFFTKPNGKGAGTTTTDDQGQFSVPGLKHGQYNVAVVEKTLGVTLVADVKFSRGGEPIRITQNLGFKVADTLTVKGHVLDSDGDPASNAIVAIADTTHGYIMQMMDINVSFAPMGDSSANPFADRLWASSSEQIDGFDWFMINTGRAGVEHTNDAGEFTIKGLRPGTYNLLAMHAEKGAGVLEDVDVGIDGQQLDLKLDPPTFAEGTVKGLSLSSGILGGSCRLVPEGAPANMMFHQTVDLSTDSQFRVGPLPPAKQWRLVVEQPVLRQGYSATMLDAPFKAGKLEVDLNRGTEFSGVVKGPKGKPLSGVSVLARPLDASGLAIGAISDDDGKYTVKGLSTGKYDLTVLRHIIRTAPG